MLMKMKTIKKGSKKTSHTRYQKTHFYFKVGLNRRFAVKKVFNQYLEVLLPVCICK